MQRMLFHGTSAVESIVNANDGHGFLPMLAGSEVWCSSISISHPPARPVAGSGVWCSFFDKILHLKHCHACGQWLADRFVASYRSTPVQYIITTLKVGAIHGDGTYFARDAKYSHDYARKVPSSGGLRQMLVVEVMVGKWTKGKKRMKVCPLLPGERYNRFNSLVNDQSDPSIFVVHHSNQAYPAYLITYR
jgi:hypothetical protein